jgi:hypothetical protein
MSTYLYISKKCPFCEKLMKDISSEEIVNHMEIVNVDVQKPIPEHKVTHVPTIVFGNETIVGKSIEGWFGDYKKKIGGKIQEGDTFPMGNDTGDDLSDPFGNPIDGGDPFSSFGDIKPQISDDMKKRINMSVNEAYESMNVQR